MEVRCGVETDEAAVALEPMDGLQPYLGILYGSPVPGQPRYGRGAGLFRLLSRLAPHHGLFAFVFTPDDLRYLPGGVAGRFFDGRSWLRRLFPVPRVIYDRALPICATGRAQQAEARSLLPASIPFVNSPAFAAAVTDKWLVHEALAAHPSLADSILPETRLAASGAACIAALCRRHGAVVIKDRRGSRALGVLHLRSAGQDEFDLTAGRADLTAGHPTRPVAPAGAAHGGPAPVPPPPVQRQHIRGQGALAVELAGLLQGREVIVQQAVDRALYQGRYGVELRVVMHKTPPTPPSGCGGDPPDRWLRTGMVCRLVDPEMPFLALGRERDERPSLVMPEALGTAVAAGASLDAARGLAREITLHLERTFGRAGELAVDFIIGADGRPRFLEANAAPAMLFRATSAERLRRRGAERILRYAAYLARSVYQDDRMHRDGCMHRDDFSTSPR